LSRPLTVGPDAPVERTQLFKPGVQLAPLPEPVPQPVVQQQPADVGLAEPEPKRDFRWLIVAIIAVLVIAAVVVVVVLKMGAQPPPEAVNPPTTTTNPQDPLGADTVSPPTNLVCTLNAGKSAANCTWTNPDPQPGDSFKWGVTNGNDTSLHSVGDAAATNVPVPNGQPTVCITVITVRAGHGSDPVQGCAS